MKSRDFVYWLQGVFEIGDLKTLNEDQVKIVNAHLDLVFAHEKKPELDFVHWLKGFMVGKTELLARGVEVLRAEINSVFEHVIDPSFGGKEEQAKLDEIHNRTRPVIRTGPTFGPHNVLKC